MKAKARANLKSSLWNARSNANDKEGFMSHRSLMAAVISAIGLTAWATYSSRAVSAQERATQPVSVYVAALKGECMPERAVMFVGGQTFVGPPVMGPPNAPNSGKTILTRFAEDSIARRLAEDKFRKNKMFRVVDSPMQADFVFCLCTRYHEFKVPAEMRLGRNVPDPVRIGTQAGPVSVDSYLKTPRDPKALKEAAFWKTDDQGIGPQDEQTDKANEKDKKRKGKKDNRANGTVGMMKGHTVAPMHEVIA